MPNTIKTYVSDGSQTIYTFEFDYIRRDFVKVLVDAEEVSFTLSGTYQVTLDVAPEAGDVIIIQRVTDTERLVDFADGSVLIAKDLNLSALQAIHIAAEASDKASGSLAINNSGAYSAGFRRISDISDPVAPRDAVTREWAETAETATLAQTTAQAQQASNSATQAAASASTASTAATTATARAGEASFSATQAASSATSAGVSADEADNSAVAAGVAQASAASSASTAAQAVIEAEDAATEATTQADNASASAQALNAGVNALVPTGAVLPFAQSTPPSGWLACDGSVVSRTTYADLFAAIGTTYGAGDGSTTFGIVEMRGEFVRGWDNGRGVDDGRTLGSFQESELASHTHSTVGFGSAGPPGTENYSVAGQSLNKEARATEATGGDDTYPRNVALLYCIKT